MRSQSDWENRGSKRRHSYHQRDGKSDGNNRNYRRRSARDEYSLKKLQDELRRTIVRVGDTDTASGNSLAEDLAYVARRIDIDGFGESPQVARTTLDSITAAMWSIPTKSSMYATLVGLLNLTSPLAAKDVLSTLEREYKEQMLFNHGSHSWVSSRILLQVLGHLVDACVLSPESLMKCVEDFIDLIFSVSDHSTSYISRTLAFILLSSLPALAKQISKQVQFQNVLDIIETFMKSLKPINVPKTCRILKTDALEHVDILQDLWSAILDAQQEDWNIRVGFEESKSFSKLVRGSKHELSDLGTLKTPIIPAKDLLVFWFDLTDRRNFVMYVYNALEEQSENINSSITNLLCDQLVDDVLYMFRQSPSLAAQQLHMFPRVLLDASASLEACVSLRRRILINLFSHILSVSSQVESVAFFAGIIHNLIIMESSSYSRLLGGIINYLFKNLEDMDVQSRDRFCSYFSLHLSNFYFQWPWSAWEFVLDMNPYHPYVLFIQNTFEELSRSTSYDRLKEGLAKHQSFQKFVLIIAPKYSLALDKMKDILSSDSANTELIQQALESVQQEDPVIMNTEKQIRVLVDTCLVLGESSFEICYSYISTCTRVFEMLGRSDGNMKSYIVDQVLKTWEASVQHQHLFLLQFLRAGLIETSDLVIWLLDETSVAAFSSSYLWKTFVDLVQHRSDQCLDIRLRLNSLNKNADVSLVQTLESMLTEETRMLKDLLLNIFQRLVYVLTVMESRNDALFDFAIERFKELFRRFSGDIHHFISSIDLLVFSDTQGIIKQSVLEMKEYLNSIFISDYPKN